MCQITTIFSPININLLLYRHFGIILDWLLKVDMSTNELNKPGSAEIAAALRRDISDGTLGFRERLPAERILAAEYGVARGTVRGALNQLANDRLVEIRPGSGTYVLSNDLGAVNPIIENASPLELINTRFALEPHICRLAVLHARRQDLERASELLTKMDGCVQDPVGFSTYDTEFHTLLAETTGNRLLIWIVTQINGVRNQKQWARMRQLTLTEKTITQYNTHHREILNAIRTMEPERAATTMKEHLESARLSLTRAVST